MNRRTTTLLAWALSGVIAVAALVSTANNLLNLGSQGDLSSQAADVLWDLFPLEFGILAALILARQPRNAIGWLLMIPAFAALPSVLFGLIDVQRMATPPSSPSLGFLLAVWLDNCGWLMVIFPILLILLLFPTGRPPSRRWRWVIIFAATMWACLMLVATFSQTFQVVGAVANWSVANPIGFIPNDWLASEPFSILVLVGLGMLTVLCAAALFIRFRRATAVERQQIKWLLSACGLFAITYLAGFPLNQEETSLVNSVWDLLFILSILTIPAAIAVAILRHHLWGIDVIIRKTLVYSLLTALLALVYLGSVAVLQRLFGSLLGVQQSPLAVVISTLVIAALFAPLRRRVRDIIDRRFFRKRYNTQQVLAEFAQTARDETDLDGLTSGLVRVVQEAMQPEEVRLWLPQSPLAASSGHRHIAAVREDRHASGAG